MEKKKSNVFYTFIGIATLLITVIGATFAYFSAVISSANNAIYANAAVIELTMTENHSGINFQLIPIDESVEEFDDKGAFIGVNDSDIPRDMNCVDSDGNEFCSVFEFTVKNPSTTTSQQVFADFEVYTNSFGTNYPDASCETVKDDDGKDVTVCDKCSYLDATGESIYCGKSNFAFAIFKGTAEQVNTRANSAGWVVTQNPVTEKFTASSTDNILMTTYGNTAGSSVTGDIGDMVIGRTPVPTAITGSYTFGQEVMSPLTQTLKPGGTVTYTILMWLHENWENQENDEGKSFAGAITFSTGVGGVTGHITAAKG